MASTDKTPKLGLNQWAAGDDVLRADFNADNAKIDAGMVENARAAENAVMKFTSGFVLGDGNATRDIVLGFRPKLVFFFAANPSHGMNIFNDTIIAFFPANGDPFADPMTNYHFVVTDTGFRSMLASNNALNHKMGYIAFG